MTTIKRNNKKDSKNKTNSIIRINNHNNNNNRNNHFNSNNNKDKGVARITITTRSKLGEGNTKATYKIK